MVGSSCNCILQNIHRNVIIKHEDGTQIKGDSNSYNQGACHQGCGKRAVGTPLAVKDQDGVACEDNMTLHGQW